jgi:endonuclease YncB( thermonuclease family)
VRVALVVLAVLLAVVGGGLAGGRLGHPATGHVDAVLDGDTIVVDGTHVRVIGIDTPEIAHDRPAACFGDIAAGYVRDALLDQRVRITTGPESHDKFGRTLADVTVLTGPLAGVDLAATLADRGLARQLAIPPNDGNAADIERRVRTARRARLGLWSSCTFSTAFPGKT